MGHTERQIDNCLHHAERIAGERKWFLKNETAGDRGDKKAERPLLEMATEFQGRIREEFKKHIYKN